LVTKLFMADAPCAEFMVMAGGFSEPQITEFCQRFAVARRGAERDLRSWPRFWGLFGASDTYALVQCTYTIGQRKGGTGCGRRLCRRPLSTLLAIGGGTCSNCGPWDRRPWHLQRANNRPNGISDGAGEPVPNEPIHAIGSPKIVRGTTRGVTSQDGGDRCRRLRIQ
jgi:hypothetical protein